LPSVACSPTTELSSAASRTTTSNELYLAVENIDHTRTKARSPQTKGICKRFHKALLDEFYRIALRKKLYRSIAELQIQRAR
jgi:hypothetical protein